LDKKHKRRACQCCAALHEKHKRNVSIEHNIWTRSIKGEHASAALPWTLYHKNRIGQNRIYTPYMTVYLLISLPKLPYIYGFGQPYTKSWASQCASLQTKVLQQARFTSGSFILNQRTTSVRIARSQLTLALNSLTLSTHSRSQFIHALKSLTLSTHSRSQLTHALNSQCPGYLASGLPDEGPNGPTGNKAERPEVVAAAAWWLCCASG
jgi:hypothetical protein